LSQSEAIPCDGVAGDGMTQGRSGDGKWHEVALRLSGDGLAVDEIEALLGLAPTHTHIQGTPRPRGAGVHPTSVWTTRFTSDPSIPFEEQLERWLPVLEAKAPALRAILAAASVCGELFLGFGSECGQGAAEFPAGVLQRIASLGLNLTLDL